MESKKFVEILERAISGEMNDIYIILKEYEGVIIKNSIVNGVLDKDCKAIIEAKVIESIKKFKIFY